MDLNKTKQKIKFLNHKYCIFNDNLNANDNILNC